MVLLALFGALRAQTPAEDPAARARELNRQGVEHYEAERFDEAIGAFRHARRLTVGNRAIARNLALALHARGLKRHREKLVEAALGDLRESWRMGTDEAAIPRAYARVLRSVDDTAAAHGVLTDALRRFPKDARLHEELGRVLYEQEQLDAALRELRRAIELEAALAPRLRALIAKIGREAKVERSYRVLTRGTFVVKYQDEDSARVANEVLDLLDRRYQKLASLFGHYPQRRISLVLYTRGDYDLATGANAWTGGLFDGKIRLPVRNFSSARARIEGVLAHELCHLFVHDLTRRCPTWLDEGLAQWHSGRSASTVRAALRAERDRGTLPAFAKMPARWTTIEDARQVRLHYAASLSFTSWLIEVYGFHAVLGVVRETAKGPLDPALERAFGHPLSRLESNWRDGL